MPALYRQYRPSTFAEIIGQRHITSILEQEILKNKIAHAYLFQGPRGTGKTTTARVFAKRLNCSQSKTAEPCNTCSACTAFTQKRSLDVLEIDAASNRGIEDIRALRETVSLSPTNGSYKIYIIDEVHMLSGPAFAALLKTLEEPPVHVVFILATTELHKVPATIASRCQLFRFRRATEEEMHTRLSHLLAQEKRTVAPEVIAFIGSRSEGCYRDAESLLGQILSHSDKDVSLADVSDLLGIPSPQIIENFLSALVASDGKQAITIATKAYSDGFDPDQFLQESVRAARDGAVRNITNNNPPTFATGPHAVDRITVIMRSFLVALQDIAYVPDPMIALELAILTATVTPLPRRGEGQSANTADRGEGKNPIVINNPTQFTPAPQRVIQQPAPTPQIQAAPEVAVPAQTESEETLLKKIKSSWEDIVQVVRKENPVASTFLRATHPFAIQDKRLTLHMQFPLHKTFFEKPANMLIVQQAIASVTSSDIRITCQLHSENGAGGEQDILNTVKEVFGAKA